MVPVVLIAAVGRNGAIGVRNGLPWRIGGDLRHFKAETMGKPVVMGRKTYQSLGRPLPGRFLIVVSRDPDLPVAEGVTCAASLDAALALGQEFAARQGATAVMVAGGAEIYRATLARADALRITEVDLAPEADSFFPTIDPALWREVSRVPYETAPRDEAGFSVVVWERRRTGP